jgi:hypothetical protein
VLVLSINVCSVDSYKKVQARVLRAGCVVSFLSALTSGVGRRSNFNKRPVEQTPEVTLTVRHMTRGHGSLPDKRPQGLATLALRHPKLTLLWMTFLWVLIGNKEKGLKACRQSTILVTLLSVPDTQTGAHYGKSWRYNSH